jgi:metallo-beta-lactamase class B
MTSPRASAFAALCILAAPEALSQANWNTPTQPYHVIDNIYYVGTEGIGAYLFTGPEGHVLLDGGTPEGAAIIRANIEALGFRLNDIRILLNSHAHFDHSGGLAELKAATGARLYAMEGDVSALEGGFYLGSESVERLKAPPVSVDRILQDGDTVELPGIRLTAHLTPGHSRGCTSWGATARHAQTPYNVLVFCSATVAANRITQPLQYEGIVEDYRATFAKAKTMRVDVPLAPHSEFFGLIDKAKRAKTGTPGNVFIDPEAFQPFIRDLETAFESTLRQRTEAAGGR